MANLAGPVTLESHTYVETSFRCHDYASSTPATTITAGGTLNLAGTLTRALSLAL